MQQRKFYEVSMEWLMIKKLSIKYSTYTKYETIILNHLNNQFNNLFITDINEDLVMTYFHELLNNEKFSMSTLKTFRYVLKSILDITGSDNDNLGTKANIKKAQRIPKIVINGILGIPKNCVIAEEIIGPKE